MKTTTPPYSSVCISYILATKAQFGCKNLRQLQFFISILSHHIYPLERTLEKTLEKHCPKELIISPSLPIPSFKGIISMKEIIGLFSYGKKIKGKRSGSIYQETRLLINNIMDNNYIAFKTAIKQERQRLPKYLSIFKQLEPFKDKGAIYYRYELNKNLTPFLSAKDNRLIHFNFPLPFKSSHTLRLFLLLKANHEFASIPSKTLQRRSLLILSLEEIKRILAIENKYSSFSNFRRRVLAPSIRAINTLQGFKIQQLDFIREQGKISHLQFLVVEKALKSKASPLAFTDPSIDAKDNHKASYTAVPVPIFPSTIYINSE